MRQLNVDCRPDVASLIYNYYISSFDTFILKDSMIETAEQTSYSYLV